MRFRNWVLLWVFFVGGFVQTVEADCTFIVPQKDTSATWYCTVYLQVQPNQPTDGPYGANVVASSVAPGTSVSLHFTGQGWVSCYWYRNYFDNGYQPRWMSVQGDGRTYDGGTGLPLATYYGGHVGWTNNSAHNAEFEMYVVRPDGSVYMPTNFEARAVSPGGSVNFDWVGDQPGRLVFGDARADQFPVGASAPDGWVDLTSKSSGGGVSGYSQGSGGGALPGAYGAPSYSGTNFATSGDILNGFSGNNALLSAIDQDIQNADLAARTNVGRLLSAFQGLGTNSGGGAAVSNNWIGGIMTNTAMGNGFLGGILTNMALNTAFWSNQMQLANVNASNGMWWATNGAGLTSTNVANGFTNATAFVDFGDVIGDPAEGGPFAGWGGSAPGPGGSFLMTIGMGWGMDFTKILDGTVLEDPASVVVDMGEGHMLVKRAVAMPKSALNAMSGFYGVPGWRGWVRVLILWGLLLAMLKAFSDDLQQGVVKVLSVPQFQVNDNAAGIFSQIPGVNIAARYGMVFILFAVMLFLPSVFLVAMGTVAKILGVAAGGGGLASAVAVKGAVGVQMTAISAQAPVSFWHVGSLLNTWLPLVEIACFGLNYLAAGFLKDQAIMWLAAFVKTYGL